MPATAKVRTLNDWRIIALLCLTIGLAPFMPEPHLFGKLRWIAGGASGMQLTDWLDTLMHGFPWILAIRLAVVKFTRIRKKGS